MNTSGLLYLMMGGVIARHLVVLGAVLRSSRFLHRGEQHALPSGKVESSPVFYVVIPVLREAAGLPHTIAHFDALIKGHIGKIIVVTTARETAEATRYADAADTIAVARELAQSGRCLHLHYLNPKGLKSDQINFAVDHCVTSLLGDVQLQRAFLVVYDADSRPPLDSLACFERAIVEHPEVNVFHQSSRFELRAKSHNQKRGLLAQLRWAIADSGALRANRFVLGYEIPRLLNRTDIAAAWKRRLSGFVYTHVTGHGLCARLSLLRDLPFPARSPLEDMHYSFLLGSRNILMVPLASLDCAEVPDSFLVQFQQLARWFYGPGRFLRYLNDPAARPGWRSRFLAVSAAGISVEWLSCAIMPLLLAALFFLGDGAMRALIGLLVGIYAAQLFVVEHTMCVPSSLAERALRVMAYPITLSMFGIAGLVGCVRLIRGDFATGKTERG